MQAASSSIWKEAWGPGLALNEGGQTSTIAAPAGQDWLAADHVAEAIQYRSLDRAPRH